MDFDDVEIARKPKVTVVRCVIDAEHSVMLELSDGSLLVGLEEVRTGISSQGAPMFSVRGMMMRGEQ